MKWIGLATALFLLTFSVLAGADEIKITPEEITVGLYGGESVDCSLQVFWDGDFPVIAYVYSEIEPDGDGITAEYSKNPVLLDPGKNNLRLSIFSDSYLNPDVYTITTIVYLDPVDYINKEYNQTFNSSRFTEEYYYYNTTEQPIYNYSMDDYSDELQELYDLVRDNGIDETQLMNELGLMWGKINASLNMQNDREDGDDLVNYAIYFAFICGCIFIIAINSFRKRNRLEDEDEKSSIYEQNNKSEANDQDDGSGSDTPNSPIIRRNRGSG